MITKKDRYFGEGIQNYGCEDPFEALKTHRKYMRTLRLTDYMASTEKYGASSIAERFEEIAEVIRAADEQVYRDNEALIKQHNIPW